MRWQLAAAALVLTSGLGAGAVVLGPEPEQVVEGHVVFTVLESPPQQFERGPSAAAVAVLVRERFHALLSYRNPGVLWFDDQYLVDPVDNGVDDARTRYPCYGGVLAVQEGDPNPLAYPLSAYGSASYDESYYVTDPNNRAWTTHRWNVDGRLVWTVGLYGSGSGSDQPDDPDCSRTPVKDKARHAANPYGYGYPCGGNGDPACQDGAWYNAVLFFMLDDLAVAGAPKNHSEGSFDRANDVSGCHADGDPVFAEQWPCPANDDNREGNSHPYNPGALNFGAEQRSSHGYTADCTGDGVFDRDCHATRRIDLYYGRVPWVGAGSPYVTVPNYRFVPDTRGSTDPYHCHQDASDVYNYCT